MGFLQCYTKCMSLSNMGSSLKDFNCNHCCCNRRNTSLLFAFPLLCTLQCSINMEKLQIFQLINCPQFSHQKPNILLWKVPRTNFQLVSDSLCNQILLELFCMPTPQVGSFSSDFSSLHKKKKTACDSNVVNTFKEHLKSWHKESPAHVGKRQYS